MNRIKEMLEKRDIKQSWQVEKFGKSFCMVNSYCLQQKIALFGNLILDSNNSLNGHQRSYKILKQ